MTRKVKENITIATCIATPLPLLMLVFALVCYTTPGGNQAGNYWLTQSVSWYLVCWVLSIVFVSVQSKYLTLFQP